MLVGFDNLVGSEFGINNYCPAGGVNINLSSFFFGKRKNALELSSTTVVVFVSAVSGGFSETIKRGNIGRCCCW